MKAPKKKSGSSNNLSICSAVVLTFALLLWAPGLKAQNLTGQWSGVVNQTGPGSHRESYPARMSLNGATGTMDYDSLHCGGQLTFLNKRGTVYYYQESLTYGRDKCIDGGMVAVEPNGNDVQWAWNVPGVTVSGSLSGYREMQSCNECSAARDRCFTGCDSNPNLLDRSNCVNRCNQEYPCVMGSDCK
ncbi:MAG: hypothetical protein PHY31_00450 [Smithellaceae bacterium]|nr:hypothetical protein [Smithellaceae bacterium]